MKKKLFGLAFIAMSLISMPVVAQTQQTAEVKKEQMQRKVRKDIKPRKNIKAERNLFEGITLTDAQKEQFKQLREKRRAEAAAMRQEKQRKDSTARADRKAAQKAHLDEVKSILTPEQYVQFLENFYLTSGNARQHGKAMGMMHKGHKGGKDFRKGERRDGKGCCNDDAKRHGKGKHMRHGGDKNAETAAATAEN